MAHVDMMAKFIVILYAEATEHCYADKGRLSRERGSA